MFEKKIGDENDDDEVSNDENDDELCVESDTDRAKHKYLTKKFKGEKGEEKNLHWTSSKEPHVKTQINLGLVHVENQQKRLS